MTCGLKLVWAHLSVCCLFVGSARCRGWRRWDGTAAGISTDTRRFGEQAVYRFLRSLLCSVQSREQHSNHYTVLGRYNHNLPCKFFFSNNLIAKGELANLKHLISPILITFFILPINLNLKSGHFWITLRSTLVPWNFTNYYYSSGH
jgi:hypothetical protein